MRRGCCRGERGPARGRGPPSALRRVTAQRRESPQGRDQAADAAAGRAAAALVQVARGGHGALPAARGLVAAAALRRLAAPAARRLVRGAARPPPTTRPPGRAVAAGGLAPCRPVDAAARRGALRARRQRRPAVPRRARRGALQLQHGSGRRGRTQRRAALVGQPTGPPGLGQPAGRPGLVTGQRRGSRPACHGRHGELTRPARLTSAAARQAWSLG